MPGTMIFDAALKFCFLEALVFVAVMLLQTEFARQYLAFHLLDQ